MNNKDVNLKNVKITRRKFLTKMTGLTTVGIAGMTLFAAAQYIYPPASMTKLPDPLKVADVKDVPVGKVVTFPYNGTPAALLHLSENKYKAFYLKCTHLGCIVHWTEKDKLFECPCHGGKYDVNGNVVSGPPPKHLYVLDVSQKNGEIWVQGKGVI